MTVTSSQHYPKMNWVNGSDSEEDVMEIQNILCGEKDFDFQVEMSIPAQAYDMYSEKPYFDSEKRKEISELKQDILSYTQHEIKGSSIISEYIHTYPDKSGEKETILGLLEGCMGDLPFSRRTEKQPPSKRLFYSRIPNYLCIFFIYVRIP